MTPSLLGDAFAHHLWATERLIEECAALSADQLASRAPGTYGSIIETLRHLVSSDCWYLSFFRDGTGQIDEKANTTLDELRSLVGSNGSAWMEVLAGRSIRMRTLSNSTTVGKSTRRRVSAWRRSYTTAPITAARCARR